MIQLELPLQARGPAILTEKDKILRYRLIVLRKGIQLEKLGMPKNTKRDDLIDALTALIDVFEK